tara:strand:- start:114 stop:401 length:288 start_codon:yes stop_codon:yes gene_type:complete
MAITKTTEYDRIEIVSTWAIHVREATVLKENGKELTRTFHRKVIEPGTLDASDNLVDTDISGEDAQVKAICNAAWTAQVKSNFKDWLISQKKFTS